MRQDFLVFGAPRSRRPRSPRSSPRLRTGWLGTGPEGARFEEDFARYNGRRHAVAVNSCTAALHLVHARRGGRAGRRGDHHAADVLRDGRTPSSTPGATPVLADVDRAHDEHRPRRGRAAHHAADPRAPARPLRRPPVRHGRADATSRGATVSCVIEDCAHAIETRVRGRKAGTFGDFGCFSFYVTKNVVTGEGGMVLDATTPSWPRSRSWRCTA